MHVTRKYYDERTIFHILFSLLQTKTLSRCTLHPHDSPCTNEICHHGRSCVRTTASTRLTDGTQIFEPKKKRSIQIVCVTNIQLDQSNDALSAASSGGTRTIPMPHFQHLLASLQVRFEFNHIFSMHTKYSLSGSSFSSNITFWFCIGMESFQYCFFSRFFTIHETQK